MPAHHTRLQLSHASPGSSYFLSAHLVLQLLLQQPAACSVTSGSLLQQQHASCCVPRVCHQHLGHSWEHEAIPAQRQPGAAKGRGPPGQTVLRCRSPRFPQVQQPDEEHWSTRPPPRPSLPCTPRPGVTLQNKLLASKPLSQDFGGTQVKPVAIFKMRTISVDLEGCP